MSEGAFVRNKEVFKRLIEAIDSFVCRNKENVQKVDDFVFEKENELKKIKELLEQRLVEAQHKLQSCLMEQAICHQRIEYDDEGNRIKPNCSSENNAVMKAQRQEKFARNALNEMNELLRYVEKFVREYYHKRDNFMQLLENKLPADQANLNKHSEIVQQYVNTLIRKNGRKRQ